MDVMQPDGQILTANIVKLTDQSTYTVGKSYHNATMCGAPIYNTIFFVNFTRLRSLPIIIDSLVGIIHLFTRNLSLSLSSPVFDDGDERTLKRSSLCLKGGRHFDKSEVSHQRSHTH